MLLKPYPFLFSRNKVIFMAGFVGIFIFLTFLLFPSIDSTSLNILPVSILQKAIVYGLLSSLGVFIVFGGVTNYFFSENKKENWLVKDHLLIIVLLLLVITLLNYAYLILVSKDPSFFLSFSFLSVLFAKVFFLGIIPSFIITWIDYTLKLKQNLLQTQEYNTRLNKSETKTVAQTIHILSANKNEAIDLDIDALLFIKSDGNYIEVYTTDEAVLEKKVYRMTLAVMEKELSEFSFLFRTHRSYIVNVNNIFLTKGNARNYQLFFNGVDESVPVSRNKFKAFNAIMNL